MTVQQHFLQYQTKGRGMIDITADVAEQVHQSSIQTGLCHLFLHHTSASLLICENADPDVQADLETFFAKLVPDGDKSFKHIAEGKDDMPSHVRTILTETSLVIPITQHKLSLGTWQGIYLWEHRLDSHLRKVTVTIQG